MRRCLFVLLAFWPAAFGANWPHWRGPFWNGSTDETDLPAAWSKSENVLWVSRMPGSGSSTPIVWGDRVFLTSLKYRPMYLDRSMSHRFGIPGGQECGVHLPDKGAAIQQPHLPVL